MFSRCKCIHLYFFCIITFQLSVMSILTAPRTIQVSPKLSHFQPMKSSVQSLPPSNDIHPSQSNGEINLPMTSCALTTILFCPLFPAHASSEEIVQLLYGHHTNIPSNITLIFMLYGFYKIYFLVFRWMASW